MNTATFTDTYGKPSTVSQTPTTGACSYKWVYSGKPSNTKTALTLSVIPNKDHTEQVYISLSDLNLEIKAK